MTSIKSDPNVKLMIRWVAANTIAWPLGILLAIILSYLIVNIFHPEETNLIIGLCVGFSIGFAQWRVLKSIRTMSLLWFVVPAIGIGLPYGWYIMQVEAGNSLPLIWNTEGVFMAVLFFACGAMVGLIQSKLKSFPRTRSYIWVLLSGLGWGVALMLNSFLLSGLVIGLLTLVTFILFLKERNMSS